MRVPAKEVASSEEDELFGITNKIKREAAKLMQRLKRDVTVQMSRITSQIKSNDKKTGFQIG